MYAFQCFSFLYVSGSKATPIVSVSGVVSSLSLRRICSHYPSPLSWTAFSFFLSCTVLSVLFLAPFCLYTEACRFLYYIKTALSILHRLFLCRGIPPHPINIVILTSEKCLNSVQKPTNTHKISPSISKQTNNSDLTIL